MAENREKSGYRNGRLIYPVSVIDHNSASGGGSGSGGSVAPNAVGTDQIQDGSILVEDLNEEVKSKLNTGFATDDDIKEIFDEQ